MTAWKPLCRLAYFPKEFPTSAGLIEGFGHSPWLCEYCLNEESLDSSEPVSVQSVSSANPFFTEVIL